MSLTESIETFLLSRHGWVSSREICERFGVSERQLRAVAGNAGLCSAFAISGDKGFKHVSAASPSEWLRFKHRLRRHGIAELVRVRDLGKKRQNVTRRSSRPKLCYERDTGQALMAQGVLDFVTANVKGEASDEG